MNREGEELDGGEMMEFPGKFSKEKEKSCVANFKQKIRSRITQLALPRDLHRVLALNS